MLGGWLEQTELGAWNAWVDRHDAAIFEVTRAMVRALRLHRERGRQGGG